MIALRRRRRLLGVVLAVVVAAVVAARVVGGGKAAKPQTIAVVKVTGETDVSRSRAIESESAVAIDPRDPRILLAGSNAVAKPWMAVYSSTDGGRRWRHGRLRGARGGDLCDTSDPTVAIDRGGRQYYAFLGLRCAGRHLRPAGIFVAARRSARAHWRTFRLPCRTSLPARSPSGQVPSRDAQRVRVRPRAPRCGSAAGASRGR